MKNFCKFFLVVFWAVLILGSGYYLVINNLGILMAVDKPMISCEYNSSQFIIKAGSWVEARNFDIDIPFRISKSNGIFVIKSGQGILTVSTRPKFKIRWQNN